MNASTIGTVLVAWLVVALLAAGVWATLARRAARPDRVAHPERSPLVARLADIEAQLPSLRRELRELDESTERRFRSLHGTLARERRGAPAAPEQLDLAVDGERVLTPQLLAQLGGEPPSAATGTDHQAGGFPPLPPPRSRRFGR